MEPPANPVKKRTRDKMVMFIYMACPYQDINFLRAGMMFYSWYGLQNSDTSAAKSDLSFLFGLKGFWFWFDMRRNPKAMCFQCGLFSFHNL